MGLLDNTQGPGVDLKKLEGQVAESDNPDIPYFQKATEQLAKKRDEVAATIGNPLHRMKFVSDANAKIADAESRLKLQSQKYWHNEERTKTIQGAEEDIKLTLADPSRVGETTERIRTRYDAAFKLGHFDSYEEYQKTTDSTLNSMQIGIWKNSPDITQKRDMLEGFKSGKIKNRISADTLIQMEDELKDSERKVEVLSTVDKTLSQYSGTGYGGSPDSTAYDRAKLDLRRTIKDPEKLNLALAELNSRQQADVVADSGISNKLYEDLSVKMRNGEVRASDITYDQQRTLGKARYDSLVHQAAAAAEPPKYTNASVALNLKRMAKTGGGTDVNIANMTTYLNENAHLIAPKDFDGLVKVATGEVDLADTGLNDTDAIEAVLSDDGIPKSMKDEYIGEVARWRGEFIRKNARAPHDDERQKFLDSKTIEIVRERSKIMGLFDYDDNEFAYNLKDDEKVAYQEGIDYLIRSGTKIDKVSAQNAYDVMRHRDTLSADDYSDYNDVIEELVSAGKSLDPVVIQAEMDRVKASRSKK